MTHSPPVLLEVSRNGVVESRHRGSFVLLGADGSVVACVGAADTPVFPRSTLKPLQAVALVESGFPGRGAPLALAAASHDGEPEHIAGTRAILSAAGLSATALGCPAALPSGHQALLDHVRAGGRPERIYHNCSGKHAAMLSTCVGQDWELDGYLAPAHPLQRAIADRIESLADEPIAATGVDGCGAPAFALSLTGVARCFAALATAAHDTPAGLVVTAMRAHPHLIGGTGRAVSELTAAVDGLLCKDGAEAVWAAALPDGRAFAAKVDDGGARALPPVLAAALCFWGLDGPAVQRWSALDVLGGGRPVGTIAWSAEFRSLLSL